MDAIGFAMQKSAHISGMTRLEKQSWEAFEKEAAGKKVIVFGTGACFSFYLEKYRQNALIDAVIDNDEKKQGYSLAQIVPEAFGIRQADTIISDISVLEQYLPDEVQGARFYKPSDSGYEKQISEHLKRLRGSIIITIFWSS